MLIGPRCREHSAGNKLEGGNQAVEHDGPSPGNSLGLPRWPAGASSRGGIGVCDDAEGMEFAKAKPRCVTVYVEGFSRPRYGVDILKVEVPVTVAFVEGAPTYLGQKAYTRAEAMKLFRDAAALTEWLEDRGVSSIKALNAVLAKGARSWLGSYGGKGAITRT